MSATHSTEAFLAGLLECSSVARNIQHEKNFVPLVQTRAFSATEGHANIGQCNAFFFSCHKQNHFRPTPGTKLKQRLRYNLVEHVTPPKEFLFRTVQSTQFLQAAHAHLVGLFPLVQDRPWRRMNTVDLQPNSHLPHCRPSLAHCSAKGHATHRD